MCSFGPMIQYLNATDLPHEYWKYDVFFISQYLTFVLPDFFLSVTVYSKLAHLIIIMHFIMKKKTHPLCNIARYDLYCWESWARLTKLKFNQYSSIKAFIKAIDKHIPGFPHKQKNLLSTQNHEVLQMYVFSLQEHINCYHTISNILKKIIYCIYPLSIDISFYYQ